MLRTGSLKARKREKVNIMKILKIMKIRKAQRSKKKEIKWKLNKGQMWSNNRLNYKY